MPRKWAVAAIAWFASAAASASERPVGLELVLAIDASASVDAGEMRLQMDGVAAAFRDPDVLAAISAHEPDGVAVAVTHWSAASAVATPWMLIRGPEDAEAFARAVETAPRVAMGSTTAIGTAIAHAHRLIALNAFDGARRVIDVSGDGPTNDGAPLNGARAAAAAHNVVVNGLAIINGHPRLHDYYSDRVVIGPGAFVEVAVDFNDFARAMREKLIREIAPLAAEATPLRRAAAD